MRGGIGGFEIKVSLRYALFICQLARHFTRSYSNQKLLTKQLTHRLKRTKAMPEQMQQRTISKEMLDKLRQAASGYWYGSQHELTQLILDAEELSVNGTGAAIKEGGA